MEIDDLEKVDTKKMFRVYDIWPEIARRSFENRYQRFDVRNIDHIIFTGMGGSGTIGDVMRDILSKENIHVNITKGYLLPKTVDSNTLIVVTSVSGNTQETLTILKQAKKTNAKIISFSSGGKIEEFCLKENIFFQKISMEHSPRASFTKFLFNILNILKNIIPITDEDVFEAIKTLEKTKIEICSENLNLENNSLNIAKWIKHIPIIYYPKGLSAVATRFKNSLQENTKMHVISEELFEACHNGVVAWKKDDKFQPILIRGKDDHEKTKERWEILKEFFEKESIEYLEINSVEGNIFSKIINLIYVTDYATIYHAIINKIDPSPVEAIDFIKSRL
jgi:glucose/mannose-6-phosphate isomerase